MRRKKSFPFAGRNFERRLQIVLNLRKGTALTMRLRRIAKNLISNLLGAIEFIASLLYVLEKLEVPLVPPSISSILSSLQGSGTLFDILLVLAIIGIIAFPIWVVYQIFTWWRNLKIHFRSQVREELRRIRPNLRSYKRIPFRSWDETRWKRKLIRDDELYKAIERFSKALNHRNNLLGGPTDIKPPDHDFLNWYFGCFIPSCLECEEAYGKLIEMSFIAGPTESPRILAMPAEDVTKRIRRLRVRLSDGDRWCEGMFYFVTVRNMDGPSIKELEIHYETTAHDLGSGQLMIIPPTQKDHITVNDLTDTVDEFDQRKDAIRLALLDDSQWERKTVLHQGDFGKTLLLFFTLKDYPTVCIPAAESTRMYEYLPCKWRVDLYLSGDPVPTRHIASFHVDIRSWESIDVKPVLLRLFETT